MFCQVITHVPCGFDTWIHILEMDLWCGLSGCKPGMKDWLHSSFHNLCDGRWAGQYDTGEENEIFHSKTRMTETDS